jgi:hypothetical protein
MTKLGLTSGAAPGREPGPAGDDLEVIISGREHRWLIFGCAVMSILIWVIIFTCVPWYA